MSKSLFTSESVTEGHPDKIADQISDAVLDSLLSQDSGSRVAVETLITTGQVHVAGEVTTNGYADVMGIVRDTVLGIGYDSSEKGFDGHGNYTLGVTEQIIFPEIDIDKVNKITGMDITFVTTANTNEEAFELLKELGMPFKNVKKITE